MKTTMFCVCGRKLEILVDNKDWHESVKAVASASKWKMCEDYPQKPGRKVDGYCPQCHYSEPRPGEEKGMMMHLP